MSDPVVAISQDLIPPHQALARCPESAGLSSAPLSSALRCPLSGAPLFRAPPSPLSSARALSSALPSPLSSAPLSSASLSSAPLSRCRWAGVETNSASARASGVRSETAGCALSAPHPSPDWIPCARCHRHSRQLARAQQSERVRQLGRGDGCRAFAHSRIR